MVHAADRIQSLSDVVHRGMVGVVVVQLGIVYGTHVSRLIVRNSDHWHITMRIWVGKSNDWVVSVSTAT